MQSTSLSNPISLAITFRNDVKVFYVHFAGVHMLLLLRLLEGDLLLVGSALLLLLLQFLRRMRHRHDRSGLVDGRYVRVCDWRR